MIQVRFGLLAAAALALISGCGWDGGGSGDFNSWNDSYNWVNYSGVYRGANGGVVVTQPGGVAAAPPEEQAFHDILGTGIPGLHSYNDVFAQKPIVANSLTIDCGGFHFADNGSGTLVGSIPGTSGTITYTSGAWSINLGALEFPAGVAISANGRYTVSGTTGEVVPGGTGKPVYSISVAQTGNLLTFTDSNGARYEGTIAGISVSGANSTSAGEGSRIEPQGSTPAPTASVQDGIATAQFEVEGVNSSGMHVKITGTLEVNYTSTGTSTRQTNRVMKATWIEDGGQTADIAITAG